MMQAATTTSRIYFHDHVIDSIRFMRLSATYLFFAVYDERLLCMRFRRRRQLIHDTSRYAASASKDGSRPIAFHQFQPSTGVDECYAVKT